MSFDNQLKQKETSARKLASIRRIDEIKVHPNADALELAVIGGWQLVTAKTNGFKTGDLVCFMEIDSWVPTEIAPFLSKGKEPHEFEGVKGERLRTIKLRGELSQGLILPINDTLRAEMSAGLANVHSDSCPEWVPEEGEDLTDLLGIKKYEKPLPASIAGFAAGAFPSYIIKTDQDRAQNLVREIFGYETVKYEIVGLKPEVAVESNARGISEGLIVIEGDKVFSYRPASASPDDEYEVTMKMDGSSFTAFIKDGIVGVCSRNLQLKTTEENAGNSFVRMLFASKLDEILPKLREELGFDIAVQGELMAPGIQGNPEGFKTAQLFVFEMQDLDNRRKLTVPERTQVFKFIEEYGSGDIIKHAPVLHERVTLREIGITNIADMLKFAEGPSLVAKEREGVVFKRVDGAFSFKVISNAWLLKYE